MSINKYNVTLLYTEHNHVQQDMTVYARSEEDAKIIAECQFRDRRNDSPTIREIKLSLSKGH